MSITAAHLDALVSAGATVEQIAALWKAEMAEQTARAARQIPWDTLRQMAFERDGEVCGYCGATEGPFEVDHKVARAKGGENTLENVIVSCASCNRAKRDRDEAEWSALHARRVKDRQRKRRERSRGQCDMSALSENSPSPLNPPLKVSPDPIKITPPISPQPRRASRLPDDFKVPGEWIEWAMDKRGWSRPDTIEEADCFCRYWQAKPGRDAAKLDWFKTWQNWATNSRRVSSAASPVWDGLA